MTDIRSGHLIMRHGALRTRIHKARPNYPIPKRAGEVAAANSTASWQPRGGIPLSSRQLNPSFSNEAIARIGGIVVIYRGLHKTCFGCLGKGAPPPPI